jgi:hypothetical protein
MGRRLVATSVLVGAASMASAFVPSSFSRKSMSVVRHAGYDMEAQIQVLLFIKWGCLVKKH